MSTPRGDIPRIRRLQPVYHLPAGKGYPVSWWVGVNWRTGQGQYPEANGVYHALAHAHSRMVHIHVWGTANWHLGHSGKGSDDVDAQGFTHVSFVANILDAVRALFRAGGHVGSLRASAATGHKIVGGDPFIAEWVRTLSGGTLAGYDFREVAGVQVTPLL